MSALLTLIPPEKSPIPLKSAWLLGFNANSIGLFHFASIVLLFFFPDSFLAAQTAKITPTSDAIFTHYATDEGLVGPSIYDMIQDHQGFIWLTTFDGLYRFDGHTFELFQNNPADTNSIRSSVIKIVYEDSNHNLWIGTGNNGLKLLDREKGIFRHFYSENNQGKQPRDIGLIIEDKSGQLWVGGDQSFFAFDKETGKFTPTVPSDSSLDYFHTQCAYETSKGDFLIGSIRYGLFKFDPQTQQFTSIRLPWQDQTSYPAYSIRTLRILEDSDGYIWVATSAGLYRIPYALIQNPDPNFTHLIQTVELKLDPAKPKSSIYIDDFIEDKNGNIWLASGNGLLVVNKQLDLVESYQSSPIKPNSLSHNTCSRLLKDQQDNLWIGTAVGELNQIQLYEGRFKRYKSKRSLLDEDVITNASALVQDNSGLLYTGDDKGNLAIFDPKRHTYQKLTQIPNNSVNLGSRQIHSLCIDPANNVWIASRAKGIYIYSTKDGTLDPLQVDYRKEAPEDWEVYDLYKDKKGNIWITQPKYGVYKFNWETQILEPILLYKEGFTDEQLLLRFKHLHFHVREDQQGVFWILNGMKGLIRYDDQSKESRVYDLPLNEDLKIGVNNFLYVDQKNNVWFSVNKGVFCKPHDADSIHFFRGMDNHLPLFYGRSVQEDERGRLWIGMENGLLKLNPEIGSVNFYDHLDGFPNAPFRTNVATFHQPTKQFIFGSSSELVVFDPLSFEDNNFIPPVYFTKATIYSEGNMQNPEVDVFIDTKSELVQSHKANILEFDLAALNFKKNTRNQYRYQLIDNSGWFTETSQNDWFDLKTEHKIRFNNLSPGNYILNVQGSNNEGLWNKEGASLAIQILPPWWQSNWAYLGYTFLMVLLIYGFYRFQLNRQLERQETENLRALDAFKNTLYTNITHEFRTPLTVISGLTDQINGFEDKTKLIKRNTANLLNLVNQILDLRKMELGKLKLELVQGNIVLYLKYILSTFEPLAHAKGIKFHFLPEKPEIWMDFDLEKMLRIVSNLLSNAVKFSPQEGDVYLVLKKSVLKQMEGQSLDAIQIQVKDMGIGIPKEKQAFIFDRFYQVHNPQKAQEKNTSYQYRGPGGGTGVGLALTKELVQLMGGKIEVSSQPNKGTTFSITLPIEQEAPKVDLQTQIDAGLEISDLAKSEVEIMANVVKKETKSEGRTGLNVLLIEDNPDVLQYLVSLLENRYDLILATDGIEGIKQGLEQIPDLVISDVMMPGKDGFEVCSTLKQDERTSHIPIILLTAKASVESRIEGLSHGADAYLAKPFNQQELFVRLEKLAELRQTLQARYRNLKPQKATLSDKESFQQEDKFIAKIRQIIESQMADPEFDTLQLCQEVGMSRTTLYRKIKALTNLSTALFIRSIRLQKGKELLEHSDRNVNEIAYEVGFGDPNYFTRMFTETYGRPPSTFIGQR